MNSPEKQLSSKKTTNLFGGRGLEKTLKWLDKDFSGYLKINNPENDFNYFIFLLNKEIEFSYLKTKEICLFGEEILKEIKNLIKKDETTIKAFSVPKKELINLKKEKNKFNKKLSDYKLKEIEFPAGSFFGTVKNSNELEKALKIKEINGFGVSKNKKASIGILQGEIVGGIYSEKFGTLRRDNAIIDIKKSFPFDLLSPKTPKN